MLKAIRTTQQAIVATLRAAGGSMSVRALRRALMERLDYDSALEALQRRRVVRLVREIDVRHRPAVLCVLTQRRQP